MSLSKESADALRQCLRIIAPHYASAMRRTIMVGNVESYIRKGEWIPAWHLKDIARLFYPKDQQREADMESQMLAAMESNELQSTPRNQTFLSGDLAVWQDCPPVPKDSPLRFWLPEWMQETEPPAVEQTPFDSKDGAIKGIPKRDIMAAFQDMYWDYDHWGKYLASPPNWLIGCRVGKGSKKTSALWNPVQIAVALLNKKIPIKKLDSVFVGLKDWTGEWQKASDYFRT